METTFIKTDNGNYINKNFISVVYTDKELDCFRLEEMIGYRSFGIVCKSTNPKSYEQLQNLIGMK